MIRTPWVALSVVAQRGPDLKHSGTPLKVLLVFDSSTGYLGATDVDQQGSS